jgi:Ca-activated chloride channel homolog
MSVKNFSKVLILGMLALSLVSLMFLQANGVTGIKGKVTDTQGSTIPGVMVKIVEQQIGKEYTTATDVNGSFYFKDIDPGTYDLYAGIAGFSPYERKGIAVSSEKTVEVRIQLKMDVLMLKDSEKGLGGVLGGVVGGVVAERAPLSRPKTQFPASVYTPYNTEEYSRIYENRFFNTLHNPLSTFSIDVDTASYANVRRFIRSNQFPLKDAVRIEEMINYFDYDYPLPDKNRPFSITAEMSFCPWSENHRLIHIGLQGRELSAEEQPPSNLVFLLDVSGSMRAPNKLPLLQTAFKLLVKELDQKDNVSIVVYAGAAGVVLPSTSASNKAEIIEAVDRLQAGGSTAGGEGIKLAYKTAMENFIPNGNNRVILATDGDFNVGVSSTSELVRMIEEYREKGVFLTVLGFGMGNYKDNRMEQLADKGNGNYFYMDNILEAKKVFMSDLTGTLFTIAKDVKIQIEFNPAKVKAYRLIGYENRILDKEDFADDTKDAGELGSGHSVTALYEVIPYGSDEEVAEMGDLKYQDVKINPKAFKSPEVMTVKLRYKEPDGDKSKLIQVPIIDEDIPLDRASDDFKFSAAVAEFGMLLRDSEFKGSTDFESILKLAQEGRGKDTHGYRAEFIKLVEMCQILHQTKNQ